MVKRMKICPFCGGTPVLGYNRTRTGYFVFVKCESCSAQSGVKLSRSDPEDDNWENAQCDTVIVSWNRRYTEELADFAAWLAEKKETETSKDE